MIYGIRYYRKKRRFTYAQLAELAGVSLPALSQAVNNPLHCTTTILAKLCAALEITIDEAFRLFPEDELAEGDHPTYTSKIEDKTNCVAYYRSVHNLTFAQLSERLGYTSREASRVACAKAVPSEKNIQALADYEGITSADFLIRYHTGQRKR